jgi:D-aspartate ligase
MLQKQILPDQDYAVVAGIDLNGLGVLRSLARAGVPAVGLDTDLSKPTAKTRHGIKLTVRALSGHTFIDDLLEVRRGFRRSPVLILTQETSVTTVSAARARLASAYRFTLPPESVVADLQDKIRFQTIAEQCGFPVPRAVHLSATDNDSALSQLRYPCVLKPAAKYAGYGARFAKAFKVNTPGEALRVWEQVRTIAEQVIVQEWIEGEDSDVYFCLQYRTTAGRIASFVGRKLCQWPPLVGGTAICTPAPEFASELESLTDRFFATVGFVGMGSMEFKHDRRDGRFYMVEPTVGRTDLQEEIAALNGVNIPFAAYASEIGLKLPSPHQENPPRVWRDPIGSALARRMGATMPRFPFLRKMHDAYFRSDDPGPYVALKMEALRNRFARLTRQINSPKPA